MNHVRRAFAAERAAIPIMHDFVKSTLNDNGVDGATADDLVLACDEAATNIVEHAFQRSKSRKHRQFILALHCNKTRIVATFFDSGDPFNAQSVNAPDIRKNLAGNRRGGYGVFLIRKLVDKIVYSARSHLNVTRLVKGV
jgi:anti-sigma regulatory factor (Ser/Thr protein kinase)